MVDLVEVQPRVFLVEVQPMVDLVEVQLKVDLVEVQMEVQTEVLVGKPPEPQEATGLSQFEGNQAPELRSAVGHHPQDQLHWKFAPLEEVQIRY